MSTIRQFSLRAQRLAVQCQNSVYEFQAAISLFGVQVGFQTNHAGLFAALPSFYPPLWKPWEQPIIDRIFTLEQVRGGYSLSENGTLIGKCRSRNHLFETFERNLKLFVAEMARRRVFVHAGAVGWGGKAILIPGRSYSGKTSLVKALVEAGATYYSDEFAVLDRYGKVHPYPQPLAVRSAGSFTQTKYAPEQFGAEVGVAPLSVGLVLISRYRANARWKPEVLSQGQSVLALLDHTVPARRKPHIVLSVLQKAISDASVLKGDRHDAALFARRLLRA